MNASPKPPPNYKKQLIVETLAGCGLFAIAVFRLMTATRSSGMLIGGVIGVGLGTLLRAMWLIWKINKTS